MNAQTFMGVGLPMKRLNVDLGRALLSFTYDGMQVKALAGDSVAAALLAAGVTSTRTTPVKGSARAPFCMMGSCFECLVEVDGVPNKQACMVRVAEGMVVNKMDGARTIDGADL